MSARVISRNLRRNLILGVLVLAVFGGYSYFVNAVKYEHYQLFNVKTTMSWAQLQGGLYRTHTYGTVDNMLLSQDSWRNYLFSLRVTHPENCGLVFDYRDRDNYRFVYFKQDPGQVISGQLREGQLEDVHSLVVKLPSSFSAILKKVKNDVQLIIDGQAIVLVPTQVREGKVGLMINSLPQPPTIFHDIAMDGFLANGTKITAHAMASVTARALSAFWKLLPFYLFFVLVLMFFPRLVPVIPALNFIESVQFKKYLPMVLHVGLAACFFWPFLRHGEYAVFSYDNLGEIFPLFFYAKHNFANLLHGQAPWLWNPLIHNGFPFFSNHWNMIYYPLNWPVFLVSDANLLKAMTLKSLVEVSLMGILAYGFFKRELGDARWALFSSVAYQMCSLLIFTMSIFPATSLFFAMTVYLYLLWSVPERKTLPNFLLLSFSVVLILTSANVAFIFYACLSLGIISIYRFCSVKNGQKLFFLTAAGWIVGTLMSSVSIVSCLQGVTNGNRLVENFSTIHDRAYMAIRLILPEIAGWMGPEAFNVLKSPNLQLIFRQLELPSSNPQNCFFVYFGVLPALILIASFLIKTQGRHTFWKVYAVVTLGMALLIQPFWGILSILSFPLSHFSYHAIILPVGICALIGYTGKAWEAGHIENKNFHHHLMLCLLLAGSYVLVFVTYLFPHLAPVTRFIFLLLGFGLALSFTKFSWWVSTALNGISLILLLVLTVMLTLSPIPKKEVLGTEMILPFLWIAAGVMMLLYGYHHNQQGRSYKMIILSLCIAVVGAIGCVMSGFVDHVGTWEQGLRVYTIDILVGIVRALLLFQVGFLVFSGIEKRILSVRVMLTIVLALTAMDLIVFNARFNNVTAPFYFKNAFYPKEFAYRDLPVDLRRELDLNNYRVNYLDRKDFNANKNLVYGLPTYAGTVGYMTPRFSQLLTAFGYVKGIYMLYPEDSTENARFLDLCAVRYSFDEKGGLIDRLQTLARLNVMYSAETISDDTNILERLQSPTFNPLQTVVLSQAVTTNFPAAGQKALRVPIAKNHPDQVEAKVNIPLAGMLLFVESYDEGWKLFIDKEPVPIVRANFNFMAAEIGAGEHQIRFVYEPASYRRNLFISLFGLLIFICAIGLYLVRSLRKGKK